MKLFARPWLMVVMAAIAGSMIGAVGVGVVMASVPSASGVIQGCYGSTGQLRVIDSTSHCRALEKALNWNQSGPPAAPGSTIAGFVYIAANGSIVRSSSNVRGVTKVDYDGQGHQIYCIALDFVPLSAIVGPVDNGPSGYAHAQVAGSPDWTTVPPYNANAPAASTACPSAQAAVITTDSPSVVWFN